MVSEHWWNKLQMPVKVVFPAPSNIVWYKQYYLKHVLLFSVYHLILSYRGPVPESLNKKL